MPMPTRTASLVLLFAVLCATSCQQRTPTGAADVPQVVKPHVVNAAPPAATPEVSTAVATATTPSATRNSLYSELKDCRLMEAKPDEAGYRLSECSGPAGHVLRVIESDGRFNVMVQVPGSSFTSLRLSELGGGAFSELGQRVEWRGKSEGNAFVPDVLVLRYAVADDPRNPSHDTSYLVPVALTGKGRPCVAALIRPGPDQSEQARRIADGASGCLARD